MGGGGRVSCKRTYATNIFFSDSLQNRNKTKKMSDITKEFCEKAIQFHGTLHGLKITNCFYGLGVCGGGGFSQVSAISVFPNETDKGFEANIGPNEIQIKVS